MRRCPNPGCPFRVRHGFAAEFEDRIERCRTCEAALSDPEPDAAPAGARLGPLLGRVAVALASLLGAFGLAATPVPGLAGIRAAGLDASFASVALWPGLLAWAAASGLVDPVLARRGRRALAPLVSLALTLALLAGFAALLALSFAALWLPAPGSATLLLATWAGVPVVLAVVLVDERWGLAHGLSLMLAALLLRELADGLRQEADPAQGLVLLLVLLAGAGVWLAIPARAAATGRRHSVGNVGSVGSASSDELGLGLTVPTCGLLPILVLASVPPLVAALEAGPARLVERALARAEPLAAALPVEAEAALAVALAAGFAWLASRPARLVARWRRAFPAAELAALEREASALFRRALLRSALLAVLVLLLLRAQLPALAATMLAAILLDLAAELKLRREHDELRAVELPLGLCRSISAASRPIRSSLAGIDA